jgi:hypothetical protein
MLQVQVPAGLQPGQSFQNELGIQAPQPQVMEPEFIPSATFAGAKPGYEFKSGAQGMGYYFSGITPATPPGMTFTPGPPQQVDEMPGKPLDPQQAAELGLHSVADMDGTWGGLLNLLRCQPKLWVNAFPTRDAFETKSPGWCALSCECVGAHGAPTFGKMTGNLPRKYERTPGTNTFQSADRHTAVLKGPREMTVDGKKYSWGPWTQMVDVTASC